MDTLGTLAVSGNLINHLVASNHLDQSAMLNEGPL